MGAKLDFRIKKVGGGDGGVRPGVTFCHGSKKKLLDRISKTSKFWIRNAIE